MLRAVANIPLYLGSFTYATLTASYPAAASNSGMTALASDVGIAPGMMLISDGTRWIPLGAQVLGRSGAAVSCPADTSDDTLATITVPANLMGINGSLRITTSWTMTNGANNKNLNFKFGGSTLVTLGYTTNTTLSHQMVITNRGVANSQLTTVTNSLSFSNYSASFGTAAIDTTAAKSVVLSGQKASAGDTLTLERYIVEILP